MPVAAAIDISQQPVRAAIGRVGLQPRDRFINRGLVHAQRLIDLAAASGAHSGIIIEQQTRACDGPIVVTAGRGLKIYQSAQIARVGGLQQSPVEVGGGIVWIEGDRHGQLG